jgi:hypothetical protein
VPKGVTLPELGSGVRHLAAGGASQGRPAGWPFNDEEIAMAEDAGYFEAAARYVPNLLNLLPAMGAVRRPHP